MIKHFLTLLLACAVCAHVAAQLASPARPIPAGVALHIADMGGFEHDLTVAVVEARLPIVLVKNREQADLDLTGRIVWREGRPFQWSDPIEATLTITVLQTGEVLDAFTVSKNNARALAQACAVRLDEKIARGAAPDVAVIVAPKLPPAPAPEPVPTPSVVVESPAASTIVERAAVTTQPVLSTALRIRILGDSDHRIAFIEAFREAMRAHSVSVDVVGSTDSYDYSIVLVEGGKSDAAAVALDAGGVPVASAIHSRFTTTGSIEACARKLAERWRR